MRDEIQGRQAALDDIHDCVVMICQACGLNKKLSNPIGLLNFLRCVDKKDAVLFCILYLIFHQFHCITLGVV